MTPELRGYLLDDAPARWVYEFIRQMQDLANTTDVPLYGSEEWHEADWRIQVAAAVRAGEAWRRDLLCLEQALTDELNARRAAVDLADAVAFAELADRVVFFDRLARTAHSLVVEPTHAELLKRRAAS
jgi:hypothetical protein